MGQVGRPSEKDSKGNEISKCLVNVTIPTKLRDFLKNKTPPVNRSQLFTTIVKRMYNKEICPLCFGENIRESIVGFCCEDCEINPKLQSTYVWWIYLKDCEICDRKYSPPYKQFCQSKSVGTTGVFIEKGCYECIRKENRR